MTDAVKFTDIQIRDEERRKEVDVRVTFNVASPANHEPFPLVVLSHGAGGIADTYQYLAKHWANQGFVVFQPSHYDSFMTLLRQRPRVSFLQTMKNMPTQPDKWIDRVRDVSCILDELNQIEIYIPQLSGKLDAANVAVAGHSYGAFTAQLIAGVKPPAPFSGEEALKDNRVKAIIAISAQGVKRDPTKFGFDDTSAWNQLTIPALYLTGDMDISIWNDVAQRKQGFTNSPPGDKYSYVITGANHMTFTGNEDAAKKKPKATMQSIYERFESEMPAAYGDHGQHLRDIERVTTLFLSAYLRKNEAHKSELQQICDHR